MLSAADNTHPASLSSRMRQNRVRKFADLLGRQAREIHILDIGGTAGFWERHRQHLPGGVSITLVNTNFADTPEYPWISYVKGDGRFMSMFADRQFDMCFSNSVIEHVGTDQDQEAFAKEIRRVARGYFVQTPNYHFPMEPHFLVPFWQYLPVALRARLMQCRDWGWMKRAMDPDEAYEVVTSVRLLTIPTLARLFPDGKILREKIGPFTKSITACKSPSLSDSKS